MAKYQQYAEYKDSVVEWLGEIPKDWEVVPIKHLAILNPKKSTLSQDLMLDECSFVPMEKLKFNSLVLDEIKVIKDVYDGYTYFKNEDILVAKVTPCFENNNTTIAKDLINGVGFGSSEIFVFRVNNKVNNRYLFYRLLETIFISVATAAMTGAGGLRRVPAETINTYSIAVPNIDEQTQIANFLDHETAQIDTLIEKQQTLIQLLKEKRQAVISHAVTKGLNPDVPMKDSGVEWLGEVPEHWDVSSLKHHVDTVNGFGFSSSDVCDEGVPFIRAGNIKNKSITPTDLYLPQKVVDKYERVILFEGDIVISMVGSDPKILKSAVGQIGVVPKSMAGAVPNQNIVILREKSDKLLKRFLFYALCSDSYRNHLNVFSHKLANQSIISSSLIINAKFMLPMPDEQCQIVDFLDKRLVKMDEVIEKNYISLELLKERRTALISAAVTGKIDVRGWRASE